MMNGIDHPIALPKFLEGEPLPAGYYDAPNPYVSHTSCNVDLPALARYAKSVGKKLPDLTKEEDKRFSTA